MGPIRTLRRSTVSLGAALALVAAGATALLLAAAESAGAEGSRQTASRKFTETRPDRPTGLRERIDYVNPDDPDGKPPAVRRVVEILARGARIDTSVPDRCTASDLELILIGLSACPKGSVVGEGFISLDTGLPGPARFLEEDVTFLNNEGEVIFVTVDRATGARFVVRASVQGRRTISEAPFLPGTPPDGAAVDVVRADFFRIVRASVGERRAYITTPPRCPESGRWINRIRFTYDDEVTQTVRSPSRCRRTER